MNKMNKNERFDVAEQLCWLLDNSNVGSKFGRMPLVAQWAVGCRVATLAKLTVDRPARFRAWDFLANHGFQKHREWVASDSSAPNSYRNWIEADVFARRQRRWQSGIYTASRTLRNSNYIAVGTDDLARAIARELCSMNLNMAFAGAVHTSHSIGRGRPPGIEASVKLATSSGGFGLLPIDGKTAVTRSDVLKIAEEAKEIRERTSEYLWVQPIIVLPAGHDVTSPSILETAFSNRVILATSALPMRPLGLA